MGGLMQKLMNGQFVAYCQRLAEEIHLPVLLIIVLSLAVIIMTVRYINLRRRINAISRHIEDFLITDTRSAQQSAMEFSVHEDTAAPLHNAVAELENRLLIAREQLREELQRTSSLTADISHQLKTPLAALKLFCELDDGAHIDAQLGQIERMERLIYSLLRLERLCADGYEFSFKTHDVEKIVQDAWGSLSALWQNRTLLIEGDARIRCDEKWMNEAFGNLLKNACEHTGEGSVIRVKLETTPTTFYASVEDDGGGVLPKDLPHLFERFYRAQGSSSTGAGIGLAIVKEIVYRHHGNIHAENTPVGLRIKICIPILNLAKS